MSSQNVVSQAGPPVVPAFRKITMSHRQGRLWYRLFVRCLTGRAACGTGLINFMADIRFVDTTLRDGNSSVWGFRMSTGMILPIAEQMDAAGFEAFEADSYNTMKLRAMQQKEDPWARIRMLAKKVTRTPLMVILGTTFGTFTEPVPLAIARLRAERMAANGIKRAVMTGFMNDLSYLAPELVRYAHEAGMEVLFGLVFAESPRHTDEYYAAKTREAMKLKPDRLYLKDPIGLLTPERTRTVIPAILANCGNIPFELHSHCTTGLAPICYVEAIKLGVRVVHTAIPPLANSAAQPSIFNVARNAVHLGHTPTFNEPVVRQVSEHFYAAGRREGFPIGAPLEYDVAQQLHQVPGGVISNLRRQLGEIGVAHRLDEVLAETARIRQDLGYPIMYTPFSQIVVTQAAINVVLGERYQAVTDEMAKYALGYFGGEISSAVEPEVKEKILSGRRAKELANRPPEPTIQEIREKLGGPGVSDDELLMRYMLGGKGHTAGLRSDIEEYRTGSPLMTLIPQLLKNGRGRVEIQKKGMKLVLSRSGTLHVPEGSVVARCTCLGDP